MGGKSEGRWMYKPATASLYSGSKPLTPATESLNYLVAAVRRPPATMSLAHYVAQVGGLGHCQPKRRRRSPHDPPTIADPNTHPSRRPARSPMRKQTRRPLRPPPSSGHRGHRRRATNSTNAQSVLLFLHGRSQPEATATRCPSDRRGTTERGPSDRQTNAGRDRPPAKSLAESAAMVHACCGAAAGVARSGMAWVAQGWMAGAGELVFLGRGGWGGVLGF